MRIFLYFLFLLIGLESFGQKKSVEEYETFNDFYKRILNNRSLKFTALSIKDTSSQTKILSGNLIQKAFFIKTTEHEVSFVSLKDSGGNESYSINSYILFDNQKILLDSDINFNSLVINSVSSATLNNITYLVFSCWFSDCNGSSCRLEFNHLFQISGNEVRYHLIEGYHLPKNILCDINKDGQLDLVTFAGDCLTGGKNLQKDTLGKYYFCIQVLTLEEGKWIALTDKLKKPYFIYLQVDDFFELDTFKLIDFNWFNSL